MPSVHQTPVLDIAVDAVSKLDGDAELRGLWAVVTKCKDSLRQGRRLENLSWRLWYREMAHQHPCDNRMSPFAARVPSALPPLSSCSSAEESDDSDLWTSDDQGNSASDHSKPTVSVVSRTTSTARSAHRIASVASASRSEPSPSATRPLTHDSQRSISVPCRSGSGSSDRPRVNVGLVISSLLPQRLDVAYERASLAAASSVTTQAAEFVLPAPTTPAKPSAAPAVVLVRPTPRASPPPATPILDSYDPTSSRSTLSPESAAQPLAPPPLRPLVPETVTLPTESRPVVVESRPSPPAQTDANSSVSSGARSQSKGKDTVRNPAPTGKSASGKHVVAARRVAALGRTGASSSTGRIARPALTRSNTGGNKSQRSASPHAPAPPAKQTSPKELRRVSVATASSSASKKRTASPKVLALLAQPQRRRGVEVITSSDFETTDEDDSSWASESEEAEQRNDTAAREATLVAARQADMFAKLPERSYSNLNVHKKPGLLTHLFHPDPSIRATLSAQDLVRRTSSTAGNSSAPSPAPRPQFRRAPSALGVSKSPVAGPVGSFVNAEGGAAIQGHATREAALAAAAVRPPLIRQKTAPPVVSDHNKGKAPAAKPSSGGYVSKGRPQDVEMESDSDDDPTDKIQLSNSVAQARLAALADPKRRAALASRQTQRISDPLPVSEQLAASSSQEDEDEEVAYTPSAPIMLPHPYNLPPPMEPQTPRTIRLQMLSREMSESLRRNLLWERRVSKQAPRRQVGLIKPRMGSDGEEIPRDPGMYALPSQRNLVRMRSELQQPGQKRMEQMQNERVTQMLKAHALLQPPPRQPGESEMEARSRIMRHRSFAGEYHAHGW